MASTSLDLVRELIKALSDSDRAELTRELILSLDGPPDPGADKAWEREISRRIAEVRDGSATLLEVDEVLRRARERLKR
jgi:putative addiction module component (TIGR02574 family)